jgi:hypothetical protein
MTQFHGLPVYQLPSVFLITVSETNVETYDGGSDPMERDGRSLYGKGCAMKTNYTPAVSGTTVKYGTEKVDGLTIAYREAGNQANPKLVLLHGFPSSSHQYRNLIPALADRFHVIAPDYPGFGNSDSPDPSEFAYTFDRLAQVTEQISQPERLSSLRLIRSGLRGSSWLSHGDKDPEPAGVAHHPEHERL